MADWGLPAESMLYSASIGDKPMRQFVIVAQSDLEQRLPKNNTDMIACYGSWPAAKLNHKYFPFDTTRPYAVLSYDDFMK